MPRFVVMRQKIIIEEAEVEAPTERIAARICEEESSHSLRPTNWRQTEEHSFILQVRASR